MRTAALLLAAGLPLASCGDEADPAKRELDRLQGTWQVTALEEGGEKATDSVAGQMRLVFEGDKFTFLAGDTVLMQGTAKADPAAKPKALDLASTAGRLKGQTVTGIYELDGDALKVCLGSPGGARPAEFKSGKDQPLVTCARAKK